LNDENTTINTSSLGRSLSGVVIQEMLCSSNRLGFLSIDLSDRRMHAILRI